MAACNKHQRERLDRHVPDTQVLRENKGITTRVALVPTSAYGGETPSHFGNC